MFSQASVILSTGEGACMAGGHAWQGERAWQGVRGGGHAWQRSMHGRGSAWQGGCVWREGDVHGRTATAANSTHPTGMHSC